MYEIDEQQIRAWWQIFKKPNRLAEVRLLAPNRTYSGYFKDVETLIMQMRQYLLSENERYYGKLQVYCIFNDINEELYGREQKDKFVSGAKATKDDEMSKRNFVLIDLDPKRISGISASDEEFERAHRKAVEVYQYLLEQGFSEPIIAISGNGYHLYCPCDMPNDEASHTLVNTFLKALGTMFTDEYVDVDQTVGNVANLTKMMGSWAKKGSNGDDRKWRMARFVKIPNEIKVNDTALFQAIADLAPKEEPKQTANQTNKRFYHEQFDVVSWFNEHGIKYREKKDGTSTVYELEECPWCDSHSDKKKWDSAVFVGPDGKLTFNCQHSHCKGKTWHDVRLFYEPDAYDKPMYKPQYRQYVPQVPVKPKYEIKEEIPELGEKWFSLSAIQKIDLTRLERVKTGYDDLDKRIGGLYMSEVTILSGSNSSGKSSWINSLMLNIVQQGYKAALWSGELRADILKTWIQMVAAGASNLKPSQYDQGRYYVPDSVAQKIDKWLDGKFFLYNNGYGTKAEQILHDMEVLLNAGVKFFVLDNLMSLDVDLFEGDKNAKQKELILRIKDFAMKYMAHVLLVAHPRKATTFLRKTDISGTSDITNAVDNVFILHRTNEDFLHAITEFYDAGKASQYRQFGNILSVEKNRLYGVVDYMCGFHYDLISRRFKNTPDENVRYGWEEEPHQSVMSFAEQTPQESDDSLPFGMSDGLDAPF